MKHYVNVPYLANVDAKRAVTLRVMVSKLGDRWDGVEAGVLGQRERNHIQWVGERPETVLLHAGQRVRVLEQAER